MTLKVLEPNLDDSQDVYGKAQKFKEYIPLVF